MQIEFNDLSAHPSAFSALHGLWYSVVVMHMFMTCWQLYLDQEEQQALCVMFDRFYAFHIVVFLCCILSISDTKKGI